jgi:hypothetical protein
VCEREKESVCDECVNVDDKIKYTQMRIQTLSLFLPWEVCALCHHHSDTSSH